MPQTRLSLSREWLVKASHDLGSARKLTSGDDPYLDTALYHCQQAAEKALKGYLFYHAIVFEKTHDVRVLLEQASKVEHTFAELIRDAEILTPYAVAFRYPNEAESPSKEQFTTAIAAAERLYRLVLAKHPELDPDQ